MRSDLGSQRDFRERKFADIKRAANSELEIKKPITSVTHVVVININFELLYF